MVQVDDTSLSMSNQPLINDRRTRQNEEDFPRRYPRIGSGFQVKSIPDRAGDSYNSERPAPIPTEDIDGAQVDIERGRYPFRLEATEDP